MPLGAVTNQSGCVEWPPTNVTRCRGVAVHGLKCECREARGAGRVYRDESGFAPFSNAHKNAARSRET